jgi:CBS domain-containing protein
VWNDALHIGLFWVILIWFSCLGCAVIEAPLMRGSARGSHLAHHLALKRSGRETMNVSHILAQKGRHIEAVSPDLTISEAILLLASKRIGAVIVLHNNGGLAGILSERDIVRALVAGARALEDRVRDHMTERVITCTSDTSVADVMDLMTRGRFRHVPVMDGGQMVGIVSIGDIVKHRLADIEAEKTAIIAYIAAG